MTPSLKLRPRAHLAILLVAAQMVMPGCMHSDSSKGGGASQNPTPSPSSSGQVPSAPLVPYPGPALPDPIEPSAPLSGLLKFTVSHPWCGKVQDGLSVTSYHVEFKSDSTCVITLTKSASAGPVPPEPLEFKLIAEGEDSFSAVDDQGKVQVEKMFVKKGSDSLVAKIFEDEAVLSACNADPVTPGPVNPDPVTPAPVQPEPVTTITGFGAELSQGSWCYQDAFVKIKLEFKFKDNNSGTLVETTDVTFDSHASSSRSHSVVSDSETAFSVDTTGAGLDPGALRKISDQEILYRSSDGELLFKRCP